MRDTINKPCPFCGGTDLMFIKCSWDRHINGYYTNARIYCNTCTGSKGDFNGPGDPTPDIKQKAWDAWNERTYDMGM